MTALTNVLPLCLGHLLSQENISGVLTEVPPLISESDLHISQVWVSGAFNASRFEGCAVRLM